MTEFLNKEMDSSGICRLFGIPAKPLYGRAARLEPCHYPVIVRDYGSEWQTQETEMTETVLFLTAGGKWWHNGDVKKSLEMCIRDRIVTADDFYQHQYGVMYESMVELFNEGKPVDLVTLQNRLKEKDVPPEVSSLEFVRDIITTVPTSANVKYYACLLYTSRCV